MSAPPDGLSEALGALSRALLTDDANLQAGLRRVAAAGCSLLANCTSASITIIDRGRPTTMASTDDAALALDEAQYDVGDGPCLTSAREGRTIRIDKLSEDDRWPAFRETALSSGIASSLSMPLNLGDHDYAGGLNIYSQVRNGFSEQDERLAGAFALQASIVVANARAYWASFELTRHLTAAMATRAVIEQAKGILMGEHRISADEAFDRLRRQSQAENRKLRDIAVDIVDQVHRPSHEL
jgi:GAF domain-containing protein